MQTFLHYRWRAISSLHRYYIRSIVPILLLALSVTEAKAQTYQTYDANTCYSKKLIDAKINDFAGNTKPMGFGSYNAETGEITQPQWKTDITNGSNRSLDMDYVAGLVAKACIEAADYYKDFTWSKPWFKLVENYATKVSVPTTGASLDDLNASKMYFALAELTKTGAKYANSETYAKAIAELKNAVTGLTAVKNNFSIRNSSSVYYGYDSNGTLLSAVVKDNTKNTELTPASTGMNAIGGWYHKATYPNQMWCDSEYMGPALLAQLVAYATSNSSAGIGTVTGTKEGDWKLIAKQFDITWNYLWNSKDQLLYHGFSATPTALAAHTYTWATGTNGTNAAYWGRAIGWYFLALVDVLENMPENITDNNYTSTQTNLSSRDANIKTRLTSYLTELAAGIWAQKKSDSNLWTNVINEAVGTEHSSYSSSDAQTNNTQNYLEASASAIYIAAYIKAMRLKLLSTETYKSGIDAAYKSYISNFITTENNIINTCASAGLGGGSVNITSAQTDNNENGAKYRNGTADYYTRGYDVTKVTTYQEGKPLGAFILASTEYERFMKDDYAPSFTDANSEKSADQTITKGQSITLHAAAMAKPTATYQWYSYPATEAAAASYATRATTTGTKIEGATSSDLTVSPEANTYYYCVATNEKGETQTDAVLVTVNAASNEVVSQSDVIATFENLTSTAPTPWTATENTDFTVTGITSTREYVSTYAVKMYYKSTSHDATTITLNVPEGYTVTSLKITAINASENSTTEITLNGVDKVTIDADKNAYKKYEVILTNPVTGSSTISITNSGGKELGISQIKVLGYQGTPSSLTIKTQPVGATYDYGVSEENVTDLSVTAEKSGIEEDIAYQWCSNTTNSNTNGTLINGATSASYKPVVTTAGTTYYYCVVSAGGKSVTSDAVAVAVLNPSNLAINTESNYKKNSNAWTPAVGGTISITDIVTSSSTGAYSITTGDAATLDGTTLTAVKNGIITLSQAADDKYKEGSIVITVRIGTNVTSDGTNEYSFTAQTTDVSDNMTITCDNITMTFGNDGFWSQPSDNSYTNGQTNPKNSQGQNPSTGEIPSIGTFYKFTPTKPGSLAVKIKLGTTGSEGSYSLRPLYVSENGTFIPAKLTGDIQVGTGDTLSYFNKSYEDNVTFDVKKGKDYYVYVTGSKLGFYGFEFTPATVYTVTYNMNDHGTHIEEVTDVNTLPETLPTPTADGYTFVGWYTDADLTTAATAGAAIMSDVTLYAKWTPITDLFSLTGVTSTDKTVASKTLYDVTSEDATVTGGSVQLYNGHSDPKAMICSSQINLNGSGGSYMKITLDNTLKAGDEIIINPSSSSFKLSMTNSTSNSISFTGSYVIQTGDAVDDQNVIYIYKGSNSLIEDISISRYYPDSDSRATFTYDEKTLTFSEKTAGEKSTYTTTLEIGAHKKGENITITPSVKDGASIKQDETVVSGYITITVPSTIGKTTTSTYTVTSKDGTSTTTYEINVKLVKDNVVLVYSNNGGTAWTWDQTTSSTQPTFDQPTLKAYLAETYGKEDVTPEKVTISSNIKYLSDVPDVATVVETTGEITIKSDANGGAKIYAILEGHSDYNDAQTFFNILVKQGYSYSVADDETIKNGPSLNQPVYIKKVETNGETNVETNLVKMTFGGWKWNTFNDDKDNNKVKSKYLVNGSEKIDQWNAAITSDEETIASIDGYKTSISGATDAVDESKKESDGVIYGSKRYGWFKPAEERDDGYLETYPYSLPVRGTYMTFEPTQNGTLTVYILQNGAWNTNRSGEYQGINFNDGEIVAGEFRPHSFYICNQRGLKVSQFSPNTFTVTTKQKVQGKYYCDSKSPDKQSDPYNIATWTEFKEYMNKDEQADVEANWNSGINGAQKIVKLDNGSYLAIQKGIVKYTFFVTANETYYLFSNFSKLGFCGANFVPSETVVPEDDEAHKMTLSDETAYPTITKPDASATGEDQYKYKFGGTVKGYVKGFTIPLFKSITLKREFKKDQWTTLSLPFNLTQTEVEQIFGKGTQVLVFDDAITNGTKLHVKFFYHEIQNILPGYPYLIRPTLVDANDTAMTTKVTSTDNAPTYTIGDNGNLTIFTVYDKAINPNIELHEFQATTDKNYTAKVTPEYCTNNTVTFDGKDSSYSTKYDTGVLFISDSDGKLYESAGESYGKGYRSFIDYTGTSSASKSLTISFSGVEDSDDNGGTTEIKVAELDNGIRQALGFVGVYNLNGQKVAETTHNLPAGIYIVNGRKLVVK